MLTLVGGHGIELIHDDLSRGLPLRPGTAGGVISVSALQWLCEDGPSLKAFFESLAAVLAPRARAALQFYPTPSGAAAALASARSSGLSAKLLIQMPHATRAKKLFIVVQPSHSSVAACADDCCPLAWPMPAQCYSARGHGSWTVFPPRLHVASCCNGIPDSNHGDARTKASGRLISEWHGVACLEHIREPAPRNRTVRFGMGDR